MSKQAKIFLLALLRLGMKYYLLLLFTILEELEANIDDIFRFELKISIYKITYLTSRDLIRFMTILLIWNSLFFSYEIFSTCLLFSIYNSNSFLVKPWLSLLEVVSPWLFYLFAMQCLQGTSKSATALGLSFYLWALSETKTSKMEPETCC